MASGAWVYNKKSQQLVACNFYVDGLTTSTDLDGTFLTTHQILVDSCEWPTLHCWGGSYHGGRTRYNSGTLNGIANAITPDQLQGGHYKAEELKSCENDLTEDARSMIAHALERGSVLSRMQTDYLADAVEGIQIRVITERGGFWFMGLAARKWTGCKPRELLKRLPAQYPAANVAEAGQVADEIAVGYSARVSAMNERYRELQQGEQQQSSCVLL